MEKVARQALQRHRSLEAGYHVDHCASETAILTPVAVRRRGEECRDVRSWRQPIDYDEDSSTSSDTLISTGKQFFICA